MCLQSHECASYDLCNKLDCVNVVVDKDFIFCTCFILPESLSDKMINTLYRSSTVGLGAGVQYSEIRSGSRGTVLASDLQ